ncbi:MAG: hypothetical protein LH606_01930 [Cytophagaceae bacterium]|nr:hypothetical protein [Cytophagaceae bacterium]
MIIEINKDTKAERLKEILKNARPKKTLRKFAAALKRGLDGLDYQNQARNDWPE